MVPRVALVNLGNMGHCPELVLALQEAGMLERWYTGLYYRPDVAPILAMFSKDIKRRHHSAINGSHIHSLPMWELWSVAARRLPIIPESWARRWGRYCATRYSRSVAAHLARNRVDIVIGYDYCTLNVFQEAKRMGAMTVLSHRHIHPVVQREQLCAELRKRGITRHYYFKTSYGRALERYSKEIDLADYVLCPSQSVIDSMQACEVPAQKLVLLPYGTNLARFQGKQRDKVKSNFRILFVGRVDPAKGIHYLIEAFKQLRLPNSELILAGKLTMKASAVPEIGDSVIPIGWVPPNVLDAYYLSADLFVLPSLSEGSSLATYEAMVAGLPVIATSRCGSLIRDGLDGFIVPPCDSEALKDRIWRLYKDPDLRRRMGQNAKKRISAFSWENYRIRAASTLRELWLHGCGANQ